MALLCALSAAAQTRPLPAPPDTWLAQRLNSRQVMVYFASADSSCGRSGREIPSSRAHALFWPMAINASDLAGYWSCLRAQRMPPPYLPPADWQLGGRYRLLLGGGAAVGVTLTHFAEFSGGLEADAGAVATVEPDGLARFDASRTDMFLIQPGQPTAAQQAAEINHGMFTPRLSASRRAAITRLLNAAMLAALPGWRRDEIQFLRTGPHRTPDDTRMWRFWARMDRALARGSGRVKFDVQAVRLGPEHARYRVRAAWRVEGEAAGLLVAWLRPGGPPTVVAVDASPGRLLRVPQMFPHGEPLSHARGYCGRLSNVVWLSSEQTGLLRFDAGYEDVFEILSLWRHGGPAPTALGVADGG